MKGFGAVCCVYDDHVWLPLAVESCYDVVDMIFFLINGRPWNGAASDNDLTLHAIRSCADPNGKIAIVRGDWEDEVAQRNEGLDICRRERLSHCMVIDADEVYDPATLTAMMNVAKLSNIATWLVSNVTYWKTYRYKIDPPEPAAVPLFVASDGGVFVKSRIVRTPSKSRFSSDFGVCHHLSYARSDADVLKKITRSTRAGQINPGWFTDVWSRWDSDHTLTNLHPIWPEFYRRAVPQDPNKYPPALRRIYDQERETSMC